MSTEPESLILQLLRDMRSEMSGIRADMATGNDAADLRSQMQSFRADVAADFIESGKEITSIRKEMSDQIVALRRAVVEYHTSVIGHGILISEPKHVSAAWSSI